MQKSLKEDYDVAFMDIQMPVRDGLEATVGISNLNKAGVDKLPIFAMTAFAMKDDRERIIQSWRNGHITKIKLHTLIGREGIRKT